MVEIVILGDQNLYNQFPLFFELGFTTEDQEIRTVRKSIPSMSKFDSTFYLTRMIFRAGSQTTSAAVNDFRKCAETAVSTCLMGKLAECVGCPLA